MESALALSVSPSDPNVPSVPNDDEALTPSSDVVPSVPSLGTDAAFDALGIYLHDISQALALMIGGVPKHVAFAANCMQQGLFVPFIDLRTQPRNMHLDHVGLRIEMIIPARSGWTSIRHCWMNEIGLCCQRVKVC